jgi:beta-mannanase
LSCTPARKARINCPVWENYYPGDEVVDIIWITVYNRGKANSNRQRLSFRQIINDPNWNQRDRIRMVDKPIYIDEVWTTAVHYSENYSYRQSRSIFKTLKKLKSAWLSELTATLNHTPEIVGVNYFNVDYTNGLRNWIVGEADRKIVDPDEWVLYPGAQDLIDGSDPLDIRFVFEK